MKFFTIEAAIIEGTSKYRFRSLYNNTIGSWCNNKDEATSQGKCHKELIGNIHVGTVNSSPDTVNEEQAAYIKTLQGMVFGLRSLLIKDAGYHFCPDWDGMLIGPNWPEAESCSCKKVNNNDAR